MSRQSRLLLTLALIIATQISGGCQSMQAPQGLTIAAASSLHTAFREIGTSFSQQTGVPVTFSFAATGTLTQQMKHGAPFDIFAAADTRHVADLTEQGFIAPGSQAIFANGEIALVFHRNSGLEINTLDDLTTESIERITIANPKIAPYGMAAQQALEHAGLWQQYEDRLIYGENVRQSLQFVESGEVTIGILPVSLLLESDLLRIPINAEFYHPVEHGIGIATQTQHAKDAQLFLAFILSPEGQTILNKHGLSSPKKP